MKITLTETKVFVFLTTLLVFLDMRPYIVWSGFSVLGYRIYTALILVVTFYMGYRILSKKKVVVGPTVPDLTEKNKIHSSLLLASALIVILFFYEVFLSGVVTVTQQPFNMAMLCVHVGLMLFTLQDCNVLQRVFVATKNIFAIILIPAIFVFLLLQMGITVPSTSIVASEGINGAVRSYDLYLGLAVMIRQGGIEFLNRLCGLFEEPGFVGTMGVFFLLGDKLTLKKWQNVVILIACFFTFSLAFVFLLLIGLLLRLIGNLKQRTYFVLSLILIASLVVGYFIFMSLPLTGTLGELQARMVITEDGLVGDNRFGSSDLAVAAYDNFMKSDLRTRLFGYGQDNRVIPGTEISIWMKVHSYKEFIFGFGFIGFGILILALICTYAAKFLRTPRGKKWSLMVLLIVFLISIYQRYGVAKFHYFCVLFGGGANLALMDGEDDKKSASCPEGTVMKSLP
ncbi:MAG: hypothetical protein IKC75_03470 [Clostridia bacterium]|nr:hypothetical protein [Clostridia bacterium]